MCICAWLSSSKITTWQKVVVFLLFSCKFIDLTIIANKLVMSPNEYYIRYNSIDSFHSCYHDAGVVWTDISLRFSVNFSDFTRLVVETIAYK